MRDEIDYTRKRNGVLACTKCGRRGERSEFTVQDLRYVQFIHRKTWHGVYWRLEDACLICVPYR